MGAKLLTASSTLCTHTQFPSHWYFLSVQRKESRYQVWIILWQNSLHQQKAASLNRIHDDIFPFPITNQPKETQQFQDFASFTSSNTRFRPIPLVQMAITMKKVDTDKTCNIFRGTRGDQTDSRKLPLLARDGSVISWSKLPIPMSRRATWLKKTP